MKLCKFSLIGLILIIVFSCGRKEYTEKGIMEIKKEIDSILHNPEAEEHFNWGSAKAYSNFRAYFNNSELIFINEDFRYRQLGEEFNRYYFRDGKLIYFVGRALTFLPEKQYTNIDMLVDPDGNLIAYDKVTNGVRSSLSQAEADLIIEHAKQLERIVSQNSGISRK